MQFGLNWLMDHAPTEAPCVLLHGDFRTGNLLVDEQGLAGVLDWELTMLSQAIAWLNLGPEKAIKQARVDSLAQQPGRKWSRRC